MAWIDFSAIEYRYFPSHLRSQLSTLRDDGYGPIPFANVVSMVKKTENNTLLSLLRLTNGMKASDPRDLIYTVLGIASDAGDFPPPNHALSVADIYQCFASAFVAQGSGDKILILASSFVRTWGYPSWVPDWEQALVVGGIHLGHIFSAGKSDGSFSVWEGTYILCTDGLIVDTVLHTFPLERDRVNIDAPGFEALLELVSTTSTAIRKDSELSKTVFSGVKDLDLMLIQYLCFNHDVGSVDGTDREFDAFFEDSAAKMLGWSENTTHNGSSFREADNDNLAEVLSEHLRRRWSMIGPGFLPSVVDIARQGTFAITVAGHLCLTRCDVQAGDKIAIIKRAGAPYLLREDGDGFISVGETYMRGLMHGEAHDDERYIVQEILIH